jgi:hypothetical protein
LKGKKLHFSKKEQIADICENYAVTFLGIIQVTSSLFGNKEKYAKEATPLPGT